MAVVDNDYLAKSPLFFYTFVFRFTEASFFRRLYNTLSLNLLFDVGSRITRGGGVQIEVD